jgi:hypothetical protein
MSINGIINHWDEEEMAEDDAAFEASQSFPQHAATPQHVSAPVSPGSSQPIQPPPRPQPEQSSFIQAFSNVLPAPDPPRRPSGRQWRASKSLNDYWDSNIPESLRRFPIPNQDIFAPTCMIPTDDQVTRMFARSKCKIGRASGRERV